MLKMGLLVLLAKLVSFGLTWDCLILQQVLVVDQVGEVGLCFWHGSASAECLLSGAAKFGHLLVLESSLRV